MPSRRCHHHGFRLLRICQVGVRLLDRGLPIRFADGLIGGFHFTGQLGPNVAIIIGLLQKVRGVALPAVQADPMILIGRALGGSPDR